MQRLNFLNILPRPTNRLPAWMMGLILIAVFTLLVISSLVIGIKQYRDSRVLNQVKESLLVSQQAYNKIAEAYPLLAGDTPIAHRVKELEERYQVNAAAFESFERLIVRHGFSKFMSGLAQTTPNTLWLNQIQINNDSSAITLSGYTMRPDALTVFMNALLTAKPFNKVTFNAFVIKRVKEHSYMKFLIATENSGLGDDAQLDPENAASSKS